MRCKFVTPKSSIKSLNNVDFGCHGHCCGIPIMSCWNLGAGSGSPHENCWPEDRRHATKPKDKWNTYMCRQGLLLYGSFQWLGRRIFFLQSLVLHAVCMESVFYDVRSAGKKTQAMLKFPEEQRNSRSYFKCDDDRIVVHHLLGCWLWWATSLQELHCWLMVNVLNTSFVLYNQSRWQNLGIAGIATGLLIKSQSTSAQACF